MSSRPRVRLLVTSHHPCRMKRTRDATSKETLRLRKQLEKCKKSRHLMAEQHDEALAKLEHAKEVCSCAYRTFVSYGILWMFNFAYT